MAKARTAQERDRAPDPFARRNLGHHLGILVALIAECAVAGLTTEQPYMRV